MVHADVQSPSSLVLMLKAASIMNISDMTAFDSNSKTKNLYFFLFLKTCVLGVILEISASCHDNFSVRWQDFSLR